MKIIKGLVTGLTLGTLVLMNSCSNSYSKPGNNSDELSQEIIIMEGIGLVNAAKVEIIYNKDTLKYEVNANKGLSLPFMKEYKIRVLPVPGGVGFKEYEATLNGKDNKGVQVIELESIDLAYRR